MGCKIFSKLVEKIVKLCYDNFNDKKKYLEKVFDSNLIKILLDVNKYLKKKKL
jgi:hypothetical protein